MMKHMVQRSLSFLLLAGIISCTGDPTADLHGGVDRLQASPGTLFATEGTTSPVQITALDATGNPVEASFSLGTVGAGISVVRDENFQPVFNDEGELVPNPSPTTAQFLVTANVATVVSSFVVNASGQTITITVRNVPAPASLPHPTVTNGTTASVTGTSTVTVVAPYRFTAGSVISFSGSSVVAADKAYNADSTQITFHPAYGLTNSTATITGVVLDYAPAQTSFSVTSATTFNTPTATLTITPTTAAVGDTITVTVAPGFQLSPTSTSNTAATASPTAGAAPITALAIAPDSLSVKFIVGPNANGPVSVLGVKAPGTTFAPFTGTSGAVALTSPAILNFAGTFSSTTPARNDTVTLTAPAGIKFRPASALTVNTIPVIPISNNATSGDSTQIRFVAPPGAGNGVVTVTGLQLQTAKARPLSLTLPTATSLTVPISLGSGIVPLAGAELTIPPAGQRTVITDGGTWASGEECSNTGSVTCRWYKITLTAPRTFTLSLTRYNKSVDLGAFFVDLFGADLFGDAACDQQGANTGGESCTQTLPAGTTFVALGGFSTTVFANALILTIDGQ